MVTVLSRHCRPPPARRASSSAVLSLCVSADIAPSLPTSSDSGLQMSASFTLLLLNLMSSPWLQSPTTLVMLSLRCSSSLGVAQANFHLQYSNIFDEFNSGEYQHISTPQRRFEERLEDWTCWERFHHFWELADSHFILSKWTVKGSQDRLQLTFLERMTAV